MKREFGKWQFSLDDGRLHSGESSQRLPPRLCKLLELLTDNAQSVVSKERIIKEIWRDKIVNEDAIARAIAELRNSLGDSSQTPEYIETIPRRGYRFMQPVQDLKSRRSIIKPKHYGTAIALVILMGVIVASFSIPKDSNSIESRLGNAIDNARRINADATLEFQPELSPSGEKIAYMQRIRDNIVVKIADANGIEKHTIAEAGTWVFSPSWSPDETKLAVAISTREECNIYIYQLPLMTRERLSYCTIPNGSGTIDWSPDGKTLAFVVRSAEENNKPSIMFNHLDTGEIERITTPVQVDEFDTRPRFSPDGKQLYFTRGTRSIRNLFRLHLDNPGSVERLTADKDLKFSFDFTSDPNFIVYDSDKRGDRNLWLLDIKKRTSTNLGARDGQYPTFNQTHEKFLYQEIRYQANLWALNLANRELDEEIIASPKYDNNPSLSPGGKALAYSSNRYGRGEIWLYNLTTKSDTKLFSLPEMSLVAPVWHQAGDRMLVSANGEFGYQCYQVNISTGESAQVIAQDTQIYNCLYDAEGNILAITRNDNQVSKLVAIANDGQVKPITDIGVSRAKWISDDNFVISQAEQNGIYLLETTEQQVTPLVPDQLITRRGKWTANKTHLYYIHPDNNNELWSLNIKTHEATKQRDGLNVGIGNILAVSADGNSIYLTQKGRDQSNLFISDIPN